MHTLFSHSPKHTLLGHLTSDKQLRIKHSQSSEYAEPCLPSALDGLYQDTLHKMQKIKLQLGQGYEVQYRTETYNGKLSYLKMVLDYFMNKLLTNEERVGDGVEIWCEDCKNYQNSLQKLENDIRQHIRLEQQLKLYQESLQQKIEEQRKELVEKTTKYEQQAQEWKAKEKGYIHKITRLEQETNLIKHDTIKNKSGLIAEHSHRAIRDSSQTKSFKALGQMKQNYVIQRSSIRKDDKKDEHKKEDKKEARKSIEKRPQSSERWKHSNANSNKQFLLAQKLMAEKSKQEKRKAIQAKFQLRK